MTKNLKYFLIFLFLLSCGYTPVYQIKKDSNIRIDVINFSGDKNIGREIIKGLENFKKSDSKNVFDLDLNTLKQESIVTKDKKGNATSYKLVLAVDAFFTNKINNKNYEKKFTKETTYNSKNNKFELDQLKINLEKNMISQILQDINIFLGIVENDL
ncbi:hypothetical protein N9U95_02950 [Candidatus Pelagibacter sp.]|nr:hypothetical protein [Candidatus Pelagibacter sp.]